MINKINQAVILCGGKGERLRPLTESTPKPMIRIDDRPFLEFLLEKISSQMTDEEIELRSRVQKRGRFSKPLENMITEDENLTLPVFGKES